MYPFTDATEVIDLYLTWYQPERHPGLRKRATRESYLNDLNILNCAFQLREWLARFNSPARSGVSLAELYEDFMWWREHCDAMLRNVTVGDLSDHLTAQAMNLIVERGNERSTANKFRRHVNAVRNFAAKRLGLPRADVRPYPEDKRTAIALLPEELETVIEACRQRPGMVGPDKLPAGEWYLAAVLFVYSLGVRIEAARAVPTDGLDLQRGDVLVPAEAQKQGEDQRLDLFPSVVALLRGLRLRERGVRTVLGDFTGKTRTLRQHYKQILVAAGLYASVADVPSKCLFHQLRKTLASQIFQSHGIHAACDRLGHSSIAVTEAYIDPRYGHQPRLVEMVDDPLSGPTPPEQPLRIYRGEAG